MNEAQFWHLIAKSQRRGSDCDEQAEQLCGLLALLEPDEIGDFKRHFDRHRVQAYRWDLWAVAYILDGGCSEDRFDYFCCWLIGRGQKAFEAALSSPETIADLVHGEEPEVECESLLYAADEAYERVTGTEMPAIAIQFPPEPLGQRWEPDELERVYPDLYARFFPASE